MEAKKIFDDGQFAEETEDIAEMTLEETLGQLEAIVEKLNDGQCSLEESFQLYKEGMKLLKAGNEKMDAVEKKMLEINAEGELHEFSRRM